MVPQVLREAIPPSVLSFKVMAVPPVSVEAPLVQMVTKVVRVGLVLPPPPPQVIIVSVPSPEKLVVSALFPVFRAEMQNGVAGGVARLRSVLVQVRGLVH